MASSQQIFAQDLFERFPEKIETIKQVLEKNKTDQIKYSNGTFVCHQFASKLFLEESSLVKEWNDYNTSELEKQWSQPIEKSQTRLNHLHYIGLSASEEGFYHAINAVLIDESAPEKIESYLFIEPQSDELILAKNLRDKYNLKTPLTVNIGTFDAFKFNGNIWQSFSSTLYSHIIEDDSLFLYSAKEDLDINTDERIFDNENETNNHSKTSETSKVVYY